jgi:GT2 family glycosyltransferase
VSLRVSVVIPTYNRLHDVKRALASLRLQHLPEDEFEVIVVEDGGNDDTFADLTVMARSWSALRVEFQKNAGPATARNRGAALARSGILAFLDSDTVAQQGWLEAGLKRLEADADLFAVEGRVLPDLQARETPFTESVQNPEGGRWLSCNLFVRRQAFLELGGFDERFKQPIREDSEFAFRAMEAGLRIAFEPGAVVQHPVRQVTLWRYFHHAQEGKYEALIRRSHPESYKRHFKWLDGRAIPAYYWAHFAAVLLLPFSWGLALCSLALGTVALTYAWCRKRKLALWDPFLLVIPALLVPYLRLYWVLLGEMRYPQSPE